jgi:hypothetical protein
MSDLTRAHIANFTLLNRSTISAGGSTIDSFDEILTVVLKGLTGKVVHTAIYSVLGEQIDSPSQTKQWTE